MFLNFLHPPPCCPLTNQTLCGGAQSRKVVGISTTSHTHTHVHRRWSPAVLLSSSSHRATSSSHSFATGCAKLCKDRTRSLSSGVGERICESNMCVCICVYDDDGAWNGMMGEEFSLSTEKTFTVRGFRYERHHHHHHDLLLRLPRVLLTRQHGHYHCLGCTPFCSVF